MAPRTNQLVPSLEMLCWIVQKETLPSSLRGVCLKIISCLYVDEQDCLEVSLVRHTRLWRRITEDNSDAAMSEEPSGPQSQGIGQGALNGVGMSKSSSFESINSIPLTQETSAPKRRVSRKNSILTAVFKSDVMESERTNMIKKSLTQALRCSVSRLAAENGKQSKNLQHATLAIAAMDITLVFCRCGIVSLEADIAKHLATKPRHSRQW